MYASGAQHMMEKHALPLVLTMADSSFLRKTKEVTEIVVI